MTPTDKNLDDKVFDIELELFIQALMLRYHYDFRGYARSSLRRRLEIALGCLEFPTLSALQERLLRDAELLPRLLNFLTIPTTEMFRDPSYFAALRTRVVPLLKTFPSLKVWVAGCSTGEEVYSLAILLREEGLLEKTLFYATDINPQSLEKARLGIFEAESIRKASKNYQESGGRASLSDYYRAAYDAVQFDSSLLKNAVFSDHSLATDSAFAEVQLVSCRNVLIYFERELQDRAFGLFSASLARSGFLGIGSKETLRFSRFRDDFEVFDEREKIYRRL